MFFPLNLQEVEHMHLSRDGRTFEKHFPPRKKKLLRVVQFKGGSETTLRLSGVLRRNVPGRDFVFCFRIHSDFRRTPTMMAAGLVLPDGWHLDHENRRGQRIGCLRCPCDFRGLIILFRQLATQETNNQILTLLK